METVTSADGTTIAYEAVGDGPPVVLVGGALCTRASTGPLGAALAGTRTAVSYDRRGRGDSGDTAPYAVDREIEDLAAVCAAVTVDGGPPPAVYAHSSGAGVALHAAAAGVAMSALVLHEPPFPTDDEDERAEGARMADSVREAIANDDRAGAIERFLTSAGLPSFIVEEMSGDAGVQAVAPTLSHDFAVMHGEDPAALAAKVSVPTLLLIGGQSPPYMKEAGEKIAGTVTGGSLRVLDGEGHDVAPEVLAPVLLAALPD